MRQRSWMAENAFDIADYVKHLHRMKVTPDTEVDDAFDCGEVEGDTTKQRLLDRMSKGAELTTEYGTINLWTLCPEEKRVLLCMLIHLKTLSF